MRKIDKKVRDEVQAQLERVHELKKQSSTIQLGFLAGGDCEVTTYWVNEVVRVDIKLPKEKEVVV